jgi:pyruvate dehydrogenase E1 component beta subunit
MSGEPGGSVRMFFREAIGRALAEEMEREPKLLLLGQDIGPFGGSYKEFVGLQERFGKARVRDTPVAEAAMIGLGVGASAMGHRTLVSITYMDFLMLGLDPLVNFAAKARFKTGGQIAVPLVVKTTAGAKGQGVAHSQCIEAWLMGVPGLKVVAPSTPADAYGLLKAALREGGPVVFIDHKRLFPTSGEVPLEQSPTPLGKAQIRRPGRHVTLTTHSYMNRIALEAAERLEQSGISVEVIDLVSLAPLDIDTVVASAARTGALATLEEGQVVCGVGAEVAFRVGERLGPVPVTRIGAKPAPVSSNPVLEAACLPDAERVIAAITALLANSQGESTQ